MIWCWLGAGCEAYQGSTDAAVTFWLVGALAVAVAFVVVWVVVASDAAWSAAGREASDGERSAGRGRGAL